MVLMRMMMMIIIIMLDTNMLQDFLANPVSTLREELSLFQVYF